MKEEEIQVFIKKFDEVIEPLPATRKAEVEGLIEKIGSRFFTVPASGAKWKHDAEPGGLLRHSLDVYKNLNYLCNVWFPTVPTDSRIIAGLFHDLGKMGSIDGTENYTPTTQDWQLRKGIVYERNKELKDGLSHAQRSVRILSQCGVYLNDDEYIAIMYHDGLYLKENVNMAGDSSFPRMNKLLMALHWADYYTAFFDAERTE